MDKMMQSLIDAPLANALRLNVVEVEGQPKKRAVRKRTLNMLDAPAPILKNARDHKERQKWEKINHLLDHYCNGKYSVEQIEQYTKIDVETIKRGMELRGL